MHIRVFLSSILLGGALATPAFAGVLGGGIGLGGSASGGLGGNLGMTQSGSAAIHSDAATRHVSADGSVNTNMAGTATSAVGGTAANAAGGAIDTGLSASVSGNAANGAPADKTKNPEDQAGANAGGASSSRTETPAH